MHHLAAEEASAHLAAGAHDLAHGQRLLVRRVEVKQTQHALAAVVGQPHHELAARAGLDTALAHGSLHLRGIAVAQRGDGHDARLVNVAHGQVQREVDVARQPELAQRPRGRRGFVLWGFAGRGGGRQVGHGTILTGLSLP